MSESIFIQCCASASLWSMKLWKFIFNHAKHRRSLCRSMLCSCSLALIPCVLSFQTAWTQRTELVLAPKKEATFFWLYSPISASLENGIRIGMACELKKIVSVYWRNSTKAPVWQFSEHLLFILLIQLIPLGFFGVVGHDLLLWNWILISNVNCSNKARLGRYIMNNMVQKGGYNHNTICSFQECHKKTSV